MLGHLLSMWIEISHRIEIINDILCLNVVFDIKVFFIRIQYRNGDSYEKSINCRITGFAGSHLMDYLLQNTDYEIYGLKRVNSRLKIYLMH